jgi:tetratricopeptide (TPR) repeat protein
MMPTTDVFPRAKALVTRALSLDPALPEAHDMLARLLFAWDWDWTAAGREFRRAMELNPNYPDAHSIYAQLLQSTGRLDESIDEARRAVNLDPQNPFFQLQLALSLAGAGRYDEAIGECRTMLTADPNSFVAHDALWDLFFLKHSYEDALREAKASFVSVGRQDVADAMARAYEKGGYPGAMEAGANALVAARSRAYVGAVSIARSCVHAGQNDRALEWLGSAVSERDTRMCYVVGDPLYAPIRRDSRFQELIRRAQAVAKAWLPIASATAAS